MRRPPTRTHVPRLGGRAWAPLALAGLLAGCEAPTTPPTPASAPAATPAATAAAPRASTAWPAAAPPSAPAEGASGIVFRDVSEQTGITFVHHSGNDPQKYFPTSLGSGVAALDYDGDGRLDLYFASTRNLPRDAPDRSQGNRLYRNLGGLRFEDVTGKAGVGYHGFCHGVAVGDVNNDGRPDLYLSALGGNTLYLNRGDGTFRDASKGSGAECGLWSSGAAFLDYDGDGFLDLYVTCYGQWSDKGDHPFCGDAKRGIRLICSPFSITPERHFLYRGRGDGTFTETTEKAGVLRRDGRGLGVVAADVNGDGKTDLYVANDGCPNFLFLNKGDGTFEDATESSGAATNEAGEVQGSMGVDVQDVDGDGRPELFVTNFRAQYNTLYLNHDGRNFQDVSAQAGIVRDSLPYVGWGCALADLDSDGEVDLFVVNGEVDDNLREFGQSIDYAQPVVVMKGLGGRKFLRVADPGPFFRKKHPSRGAAFADLDDDGDLDVVVSRMDQTPAVLVNESPRGNWVRFALEATASNRSAIGAVVEVHAGGRLFQRHRKGGDSYLSANDPRLLVGLGPIDKVDYVEVRWPSGRTSRLESPGVGKTHRVVEPAGAGPDGPPGRKS